MLESFKKYNNDNELKNHWNNETQDYVREILEYIAKNPSQFRQVYKKVYKKLIKKVSYMQAYKRNRKNSVCST